MLFSSTISLLIISSVQDPSHKDRAGTTVMHKAAANGHLNCLQLLVEKGGKLDIKDITGCIPLHWAARNGHLSKKKLHYYI